MEHPPYIILTLSISEEKDKSFIAICNELGTSTFGDSIHEVETEIRELILLHLNTLEETGERERFFKENDIQIHNDIPPEYVDVRRPIHAEQYLRPIIQPITRLQVA